MGEEKANMVTAGTLFPILGQGPTGIARLAAEGEKAGDGHLVEFRMMEPRSLLNRVVSKRGMYFTWSINPYRGCEFGCRYCYARYTHEYIHPAEQARQGPRDGNPALDLFEREIYIKQHAAWLLRQELKEVRPGEQIALGTATDPYQPIERDARVTRSLLEVFAERQGLRLGIVTKSTLIERDIDLLVRIARQNQLTLHLTITTPDAKLARILEPRAPRPDLRFRTVERLRAAGLRVGILCSPLMPGITDTPRALEGMARRAKKAGASFFAAQPLFLKPCSKPVFLRFIQENFPELEKAYAARYGNRAFVSKAYQERVAALVRAVVRKHGLEHRYEEVPEREGKPVWPVQAELWPAAKQARSA
jgi:DNA repair photolyase